MDLNEYLPQGSTFTDPERSLLEKAVARNFDVLSNGQKSGINTT